MSRVVCGRKTGLNIEIHPKISGEDREAASRVGSRKDALATSIGEFGAIAGRSSQQCVGAPAQQSRSAGTDGRRGPRGGDPEIESPGRGVAARRRVVPRRLGFCPHQRWIWPHCILEQQDQDHAARPIGCRTSSMLPIPR